MMEDGEPNRVLQLASFIGSASKQLCRPKSPTGRSQPSSPVQAHRRAVVEAATELAELLLDPFELIMHHHEHHFWFYDILDRFDIPSKVPLQGTISYPDLAAATGILEKTLKSMLRYAMACRVFAERPPSHVSHTAASRLLVSDGVARKWIAFTRDEFIKPALHAGQALQKWPASGDPAETPFMLAENSAAPNYWAYPAQNPPRLSRFMSIMAESSLRECQIIGEIYDWTACKSLVELGGSPGELATYLTERFPNLESVVQDLQHVISNPLSLSGSISSSSSRVKLVRHDFFQAQPIRGADVYLFRHCFHNWNDNDCVRILRALVPALKPRARVLIVDAILPQPHKISILEERRLRCIDNNMRHVLNAGERDLSEWKELFAKADSRFQFLQAKAQPSGTQCGLIVLSWAARE